MLVFPPDLPGQLLNMIKAAGSHIATVTFNTFLNDIVPDGSATAGTAQFTPTDYIGGDATAAVTLSAAALNEDGLYHLLGTQLNRDNTGTTGNDVYGYWCELKGDTTSAVNTWFAERFDNAPIAMAPGDLLRISPELVINGFSGHAVVDI